MTNPRSKTVQSLARGLEVLSVVSSSDQPVGITEISRRLNLAKGSVARIVATLAEKNCLVREANTKKYSLGMKMWELGHRALVGLDLRSIARPIMSKLHVATGDTVHLSILSTGGEIVLLDKLDSTKGVRPDVRLGTHLPPYCVSAGKAVLAFSSKNEVDRILSNKLHQYTKNTIVKKSMLYEVFKGIREQGVAVNDGEYRDDVSGVAAPILDHAGIAVAAVGISIPVPQMKSEIVDELAPQVLNCARQISSALGYRDENLREPEN